MPQMIEMQFPAGVARGGTPSVAQGRWWDANLVRWRNGVMSPIGGWDRSTSTPFTSTVRKLFAWQSNDNARNLGILTQDGIWVETLDGMTEITPADFEGVDDDLEEGGYGTNTFGYWDFGNGRPDTFNPYAPPFAYHMANWGEDLLIVSSSDARLLYYDTSAGGDAAVVADAPLGFAGVAVTEERHVMGIGGENARRVMWSSREDHTDWDFSSLTNTAGFLDLDCLGPIRVITRVRNGILLLTEGDVWLVRYVGLPYVYGAEQIGTGCGVVSPMSVATVDDRAFWMSSTGFWVYEGGAVKRLPCDMADFVFGDFNRGIAKFTVAASINGNFPEVWFAYPSAEAAENDRIAIFNYEERWWAPARISRTAMESSGVYPFPIAAGSDGHLYRHESGWTAAGATRVGEVWAETSTQRAGTGERVLSVTRAQPDSFTGATATRFRFFGRYTPEGTEYEHGPYTAREDGWMDVRFSARDIRLRVEATRDADWSIGVMRLTAQERGRR